MWYTALIHIPTQLRSVAARSKAEADITIWRMTSRVGILSSEVRPFSNE